MVNEQSRVLLVAKVHPKLCVQAQEKLVDLYHRGLPQVTTYKHYSVVLPPLSNGHCPTDRITKMLGDMAVALPTRLLSLTWQVGHGTTGF